MHAAFFIEPIVDSERVIPIDAVADILTVSSYWDIIFLSPILLLLDGFQNDITDHQNLLGDSDPEARRRRTQKDSKFKKQWKHSACLDILILIMIREELLRIGKKSGGSSK
ncbi:hypothetical protein TNIN_449301 [Trichonephila inaurata madagascariensis]|uniref:Uncharacterized protein n=1 Tax=Trichonephila inaurata madagascariensis TaxID=2747483 RepID=A0A8X7CBI7_9ARAC|nr:hypothetical protein TNIN_449301 [Trichonephila inaurata madagascariensis]